MRCIEIPPLFDAHVHLRDYPMMATVAPYTDRCCAYALVMPNTDPPLTTTPRLHNYLGYLGDLKRARPLVAFMLTDATTAQMVRDLHAAGAFAGKLYPKGATTNSSDGVTLLNLKPCVNNSCVLRAIAEMEKLDMPLCMHGECPEAFCMDREGEFINNFYDLRRCFPKLRMVLEHITTKVAVNFIRRNNDGRTAATITLHHLLLTLDDVIGGLIRPHNFCKPIPKWPQDRDALLAAAFGTEPFFFLGSDSAPHFRILKECASGCAGVFSAPALVEGLVGLADKMGVNPNRLAEFATNRACDFYHLPRPCGKLSLVEDSWAVPAEIGGVVPFMAGQQMQWRLEGNS